MQGGTVGSLNGHRTARIDAHVPPSGGWLADVALESGGVLPPGPAVLVIADLTLHGAILRGGNDGPDQPRMVLAGGAGWRRLLPVAGAYDSPGEVRLSTVLRDLAALATYPGGPASGEPYDGPADVQLGDAYEWDAAAPTRPTRARTVLADLIARGVLSSWRVATNGRTRFDAWPSTGAVDGLGRINPRNSARGMKHIGLDVKAAAFLPGCTVEGILTARTVFHEDGSSISCETWES